MTKKINITTAFLTLQNRKSKNDEKEEVCVQNTVSSFFAVKNSGNVGMS
jgi:hypothetical protein